MRNRLRFSQQHDLGVLIVALALLAGGALVHRFLAAPNIAEFSQEGLHFERPGGWLPGQVPQGAMSPLARNQAGFGAPAQAVSSAHLHTVFVSPQDARRRIEVRIAARPAYSNLRGALAVQRLGEYGELYWARHSGNAAIEGRDWLRTEFRYAFKASKGGSPQIAEAIEYAIVNAGRLYVVTLHDAPDAVGTLDSMIAKTLRLSTQQNSSEEATR